MAKIPEWDVEPLVLCTGVGVACVYLDLVSIVLWKWAVYVGCTGSCVLGTGFGIESVPVVGDRASLWMDLLFLSAVAAFVLWTASLLALLLRRVVDLPVFLDLRCEPVVVRLLHSGTLLSIVERVLLRACVGFMRCSFRNKCLRSGVGVCVIAVWETWG